MRRKRGPLVLKVAGIERHRNGVGGAPFWAVDFVAQGHDGTGTTRLRGIVFDQPGVVAVIEPSDPTTRWRGDNFEDELRRAIADYEKAWYAEHGGAGSGEKEARR
jgi:hypothetical protein